MREHLLMTPVRTMGHDVKHSNASRSLSIPNSILYSFIILSHSLIHGADVWARLLHYSIIFASHLPSILSTFLHHEVM